MKLETEVRDDHQVRLITEIEPDQYEKSKHKAARKIANETRIPGFRPGKAPYDMVRRYIGEAKINSEALELLMDAVYPEAIKEAGIEPFGPGSLEEILSTEPVKFAFLVPLAPTVNLGDYKEVRVPYEPPVITDEKVDQYVEQLRTSYATAEPANHPAQNGDLVYASFSAVDLHPEEGKDAELIKDRPIQTVVKDDTGNGDEEWPYPGFAHALAGLSEGDEKTSQYTFSDQSTYEALKGREVEFHTKVNAVKSLILPELNDEFAQNLGEFKDVAEMRGALRSNLEKSAQDEYEQEFFTHVLEHVREGASLKYPPQMLQDEIDSILKNVEQDLAGQKMDLDTYLKVRQTDREKFIEEEVKPAAIRRLERSLLVEEIAKAEKIQISNEELQSGFAETLSQLESAGDFDKVRKRVGNERMANAVAMEAASRLMNRRVLDRLKQIATGQAEAAPAEDAAPQAEPAAEVADTKAVEKEVEKPSEEGSKTDSE